MLTPAISASRTSEPPVIIEKAFSTQVWVPPFLNLLPLLDATTTGFALFGVIIVGAWPNSVFGIAAAATAPAAACHTKSRRLGFFIGFVFFFHWRRGPTPAARFR